LPDAVIEGMQKLNAGAGSARIIRVALYFDNPWGTYYNEPILLKK
jgi:hypothetical protein